MSVSLEKSSGHLLHVKTANRLLEHLRKENLQPETRIKTLRELAREYDVSYQTIQKSIQLLKSGGILDIRKGDGIYLISSLNDEEAIVSESAAGSGEGALVGKPQRRTDHAIAIVSPVWASEDYPEPFGESAIHRLLAGFLAECDPFHWGVEMIYSAPPDEASHPEFVDKILRRGVDGVLWLRPNIGHRMNMMRLIDRGLLVVGCGREFPGIPSHNVSEDHEKVAIESLKWLKAQGKTRIAMLTAITEGRNTDPFAAELYSIFMHAAKQVGVTMDESLVCEAFGLPNVIREDAIRLFFQRNRKVDGVVCVFNPLLSTLEELALRNELPQSKNLCCVDLMSDYRQFVPRGEIPFGVVGVQNPLEEIGRALAGEFIKHWQTASPAAYPLPDPRIVALIPPTPDLYPIHDQ